MSKFVLTPDAIEDLDEIWVFIARDDPIAADRVEGQLWDAFERIVAAPSQGHKREDLTGKPVRFWTVRKYLIVYRPDTSPLQILRVLHGARDAPQILSALK